ncbi:MAG: hypothetical protein E6559_09460, partial [Pantoea sp.]|nr:hypothetical protein [Pantoea sp.]
RDFFRCARCGAEVSSDMFQTSLSCNLTGLHHGSEEGGVMSLHGAVVITETRASAGWLNE